MKRLQQQQKPLWLLMFVLYIVSFGIALFNSGIYWDDWTLLNTSPAGVNAEFTESGYITFAFFLNMIGTVTLQKVLIFRCITFLSYFISAICVYYILRNSKGFQNAAFFIALFSIIVPFNHARISLVITNYVMNYLFFFSGFALLVLYARSGNFLIRIISLILLFLSFFTNSFFFFYLLVLIYIYADRNQSVSFKGVRNTIKKYPDYFILPIVFLVLKFTVLSTSGLYADYNSVNPLSLALSPLMAVKYIGLVLHDLSIEAGDFVRLNIIAVLVGTIMLFFMLRKYTQPQLNKPLTYILFALFLLWLGCLPYAMLGKVPLFYSWNSRHQLLLPVGMALIIIGFCTWVSGKNKNLQSFLLSFFLIVFTGYNLKSMIIYQADWFKQLSIMHQLNAVQGLKSANTIRVSDQAKIYNAKARSIVFYEYTGMMNEILHEDVRFATQTPGDTAWIREYIPYPQYHLNGYVPGNVDYHLIIQKGNVKLDPLGTVDLLIGSFIDPVDCKAAVNGITKVSGEQIKSNFAVPVKSPN